MATQNLSTGQIILGFIGGVIGGYFGGPYGAILGASIGMTIGGWIDPPDLDYEKPDKSDLSINKSDEAIPLPDVLGTTKLGGNVIAYWGNRSEKIEEDVGGKGGGDKITTGYKYYMTWEMGVCEGPVDEFQTIFKSDDLMWYNGMTAPDQGIADDIWIRYSFNELRGSQTDDKGDWNFDGVFAGGVTWSLTDGRKCVLLDGDNDYIYPSKLTNYCNAFKGEFTISFWYNTPADYHGNYMFSMRRREYVGYWKNIDEIAISFYSNQMNCTYRVEGDLSGAWLRAYNALTNDGDWHNIQIVYSSDYIRAYKDTVQLGYDPSHDGWMNNQNMSAMGSTPDIAYIGRGVYGGNFGSKIDEWQIYDKALNVYERAEVYGNPALTLQGQCGSIDNYGRFCVYYGTDIQEKPSTADGISNHSKLMPYRGLAYCHFEDFYIGQYNAVPTTTYVVTKRPETDLSSAYKDIGDYSYNPIHAIYYLLIKSGVDTNWIDADNFDEAAEMFYNYWASTGINCGINLYMGANQTALGYITGILARTNCVLYYDHGGKWKIKVLDEDIGSKPDVLDLITIDEEDMLSTPTIERPSWNTTYNEVKINYFGRLSGSYVDFADAIHVSMDPANQEIQNRVNPIEYSFGGIDNSAEAARIAERELINLTYPRVSIRTTVNRNAFELQVADEVIINYSPYDIDNAVYLIGNIIEEDIDSENITITCVEDIRYITTTVSGEGEDREIEDVEGNVVALTFTDAIEAPYISSGPVNGIIPLVSRKLGWEIGYYVYMSTDDSSYTLISDEDTFTTCATLTSEYTADTKTVDDDVGIYIEAELDADMAGIETTTRANLFNDTHLTLLKGDNGNQELISWESITPTGADQYKLEGIVRGRYDTLPCTWSGGSRIYFIYKGYSVTTDDNYLIGTTRYLKYVPYSSSDVGELSEATAVPVDLVGRSFEGYTPRSFIANEMAHHPTYTGDVSFTWTDQYRAQALGAGAGFGNAATVIDDTGNTGTYYSIDIVGAGGTTNYVVQGDSYTYTSAQNTTDNGGLFDFTATISGYNTVNNVNFYSDQATVSVEKV